MALHDELANLLYIVSLLDDALVISRALGCWARLVHEMCCSQISSTHLAKRAGVEY